MSDNPTIDNPRNGDYKVRATDLGAMLGDLQHMRIDIGAGLTESLVSAANPLPVTGTITGPLDAAGTIGNNALLATAQTAIKKSTYFTNAAGDASTLNFASHNMQIGDWAYWVVGAQVRQVTARTATSVTVSPAFSSAPGSSATIQWYRTAIVRYVYESGVSGTNGGFVATGGIYDDGAGSITWTPFATSATGYQYVNAQITSPLAIVSPNHNGVATATMVGEKVISTHVLSNSSTTTTFVLNSGTTPENVFAGDIAEIYVTATGASLQRTTIGSYAAAGSTQVTALVADALYFTPDNTYSIRILRRQGLRTAASAPASTDFGVITRNIPSGTQDVNNTQINGVAMSVGNGVSGTGVQRVTIANDSTGVLASIGSITSALPTGANTIGAITFATPTQAGGPSTTYYASLTNTGTTSLSSARKMTGYNFGNASTTVTAYVKIYDKSSAATSSDTPIRKIVLAPGADAHIDLGASPLKFTNGISIRATTVVTDSNTTSPTANDVFGDIEYV